MLSNEDEFGVKSIEDALLDHIKEQKAHVAALTSADQALDSATKEIAEGRRRLQNALDRYKERMSGTTK